MLVLEPKNNDPSGDLCPLARSRGGHAPADVAGRSMGFAASGVVIATSKNNGSPLLGLKELETSEIPEALKPQVLLVTYWSVSGGEQPLSVVGAGCQRHRTPLVVLACWLPMGTGPRHTFVVGNGKNGALIQHTASGIDEVLRIVVIGRQLRATGECPSWPG